MKTIRMRARAGLVVVGALCLGGLLFIRAQGDQPLAQDNVPAPVNVVAQNLHEENRVRGREPTMVRKLAPIVEQPVVAGRPPAAPPPDIPALPKGPKAYPDFGEAPGKKGVDAVMNRVQADRFSSDDERLPVLPVQGDPFSRKVAPSIAKSEDPEYPRLVKGKFIPGNRIVHFDLKGAAPRVDYFREVFKLIASLGATGVLLEWEDMFPFSGPLKAIAQSQAYTPAQIRQILGWAQEANLDIIPLVQTFGHLEYILKYPQYAKYRQADKYPQVICLGDEEAVELVKSVVDQVMAIHKDFPMPYFHIGADEAFQIGMCGGDQELMRKELDNSRERLMLRHLAHITSYVKNKYKTKVLMWHDMLNNVDNDMIKEYQLGELVEPVVWAYAERLNEYLYPDMWQRFGDLFPYMWGGSAFKGADGPSRYYSNIPHYLQNHISWVSQMTSNYRYFTEFRGLILTGWQRFDHFAVLCEILPVGIPSLAVNLATIGKGVYDRSVLKDASTSLGCSSTLDIESQGVAAYCTFPGSKIYQLVQQLKITIENTKTNLHDDYQVHGWLSRFNMVHNYSQPWYLDQINDKLQMYLSDFRGIHTELSTVFFPDMVDEWIFEYVEPELGKLREMEEAINRLSALRSFPARPFPIALPPKSRARRKDPRPTAIL